MPPAKKAAKKATKKKVAKKPAKRVEKSVKRQNNGNISGHKGVAYQIIIAAGFIVDMLFGGEYEEVRYCNFTHVDDIYVIKQSKRYYYQCKLNANSKPVIKEVLGDFLQEYLTHDMNVGALIIATQSRDGFIDQVMQAFSEAPKEGDNIEQHIESRLGKEHGETWISLRRDINKRVAEWQQDETKSALTRDFDFIEFMGIIEVISMDIRRDASETIKKCVTQRGEPEGKIIYDIIVSRLVHDWFGNSVNRAKVIEMLKDYGIEINAEGASL